MGKNYSFMDIICESPCVFTIGVAGDSGSGKTTFTDSVRKIFGEDLVSTITLDDYHILGREERTAQNITPLSFKANDLALLEEHVFMLKSGKAIQKPVYNHKSGKLDSPVYFEPSKIIIFEGLHSFSTPVLRRLMDFTIFVNPDKNVKYDWKIKRDVQERGYDKNDVISELKMREDDYVKYVEPQVSYANAVVEISDSVYGKRFQNARNVYRVTLSQEKMDETVRRISLNFNIFAINSLDDRDFCMEFRHSKKYGKKSGALSLDGEFQYDVIRNLEKGILEQLNANDIPISPGKPYFNAVDLVKLLLSWRIINKRMSMGPNVPGADRCRL
ncbi:phosphoribulokinase [Methanomicrobium sp. W14]|uniref:phosphoribulokinase n=1 Tax=Methanomicrobium sp. W14 TaxID=2817839 RepID=UPI001AE5C449|nr:phosphoribulokinase [Methanomicrobium sp. W14]MBP2133856.1 phosphoribulokinase [Methanomicrobium sp. W14]